MYIWLLILILFTPTLAQAVYSDAEIARKDPLQNGMKQWIVEFHGDAGEPAVTRIYTPTDRTDATTFGQWVQSHLDMLNAVKAVEDDPSFAARQKVTPVPLSRPTRNEKVECYQKLEWYDKLQGKSFIGPLNGVAATLKADLERVCKPEYFQ